MTPRASLAAYRRSIRAAAAKTFYWDRHFETAEQWGRLSGSGHRGWALDEYNPTLESLLNNRAIVILGEPGSGKSTSARAAAVQALDRGWLPIVSYLRSYKGSILKAASQRLPPESKDRSRVRLFVLDGFDELAESQVDAFVNEVAALEASDPNARFVLTSRQAFFVNRENDFSRRWPVFYITDLSSDGVDAFVAQAKVDRASFRAELTSVALHSESKNPFVLGALLAAFARNGALPKSRSEAVRELIDITLESRPATDRLFQRRALRMLAMAMEVMAKNELPRDIAVQVLVRSIDGISEARAKRLLEELSQAILLQTGTGLSFQMRSYGEYLAAEELSEIREPDRPLSLMLLKGQRVFGASWLNCAAFLVELHPAFRRVICRQFAEVALPASPSKFADADRTKVVSAILNGLADRREHLMLHPTISAHRLAAFVLPSEIAGLRQQLRDPDELRVANAACLLCVVGDKPSAQAILELAVDTSKATMTRYSAAADFGNIGDASMVPTLLGPDSLDVTRARLGAATALMQRHQFGDVLTQLDDKTGSLVELWQRFDSFTDPDDVAELLQVLAKKDSQFIQNALSGYMARICRAAGRLWRNDFAAPLADLVCRLASEAPHSLVSDDLIKGIKELPEGGDLVGQCLLEQLITRPDYTKTLDSKAYKLVPLEPVKLLKLAGQPAELLQYLRAFGRAEVSKYIRPPGKATRWKGDAQYRQIMRREREHKRELQSWLDRLTITNDGVEILDLLARLHDRKLWPDLKPSQVQAARDEASRWLVKQDLRHSIQWLDDMTCRIPRPFWLVLDAIDRYEFELVDDRPMAHVLLEGMVSDRVLRYHARHKLTPEALNEATALLGDASLHDRAIEGVLRFWKSAGCASPAVLKAAAEIAQGPRSAASRESALEVVLANETDLNRIALLARSVAPELKERAELHLLEKGHRATAEQRLSRFVADPNLLKAGETNSPFDNPLRWLTFIRSEEMWPKLVKLRAEALRLGLGRVSQIIAGALGEINMLKMAEVVAKQAKLAPIEWQPFELRRAAEFRREGAIRAQQATTLDEAIRKMKQTTTLDRFKIWLEGWHDVSAVEKFLSELPSNLSDRIVVDCFNGWATILGRNWRPDRLGDGCADLIVLLDGDRGLDLKKSGRPIRSTPEVRKALKKLDDAAIEFVILKRYAVENYFPQSAFEKVLGPGVAAWFPLDETESVESQLKTRGYSKHLNTQLANETKLSDLAGTDLGAFFDLVRDRVA